MGCGARLAKDGPGAPAVPVDVTGGGQAAAADVPGARLWDGCVAAAGGGATVAEVNGPVMVDVVTVPDSSIKLRCVWVKTEPS